MISILAGVSLSKLEAAFPKIPVIRAMPNTPATVGAGITAIAFGSQIQANHHSMHTIEYLLGSNSKLIYLLQTCFEHLVVAL